jgi:hypothetical protein
MNHDQDDPKGSDTGSSGSSTGNDERGPGRKRGEGRRGQRREHGRHRHHQRSHGGFASWAHRKERVLHTRISEDLHDALHRAAEELRVPVSNLVRNVLEDVTKVVDGVSESVGGMFGSWMRDARERRAAAEAEAAEAERPRPDFSDVTGWQPIRVNRPGPCADCGTSLERGDEAYLGLSATGAPPKLLCCDCLDDD